jgi:hypothetical protein
MRSACWIPKATSDSQNMKYLLFFHCNNGHTNAPQCCVVFTLHALPCIIYAKIWNTNGWTTSVLVSWAYSSYWYILRVTQRNVLTTFDYYLPSSSAKNRPQSMVLLARPLDTTMEQNKYHFQLPVLPCKLYGCFVNTIAVTAAGGEGHCNRR